jgi:hypothetical protein
MTIRIGGYLHDIGKIGIADAVLLKPGKLTDSEMAEMRRHSEIGAAILEVHEAMAEIAQIVRHHHERWDGRGYPDALVGAASRSGGRIIAVADAFSAMTSDRIYRPALPMERAWAELRAHSGTQFDPEIVAVFEQVVDEEGVFARWTRPWSVLSTATRTPRCRRPRSCTPGWRCCRLCRRRRPSARHRRIARSRRPARNAPCWRRARVRDRGPLRTAAGRLRLRGRARSPEGSTSCCASRCRGRAARSAAARPAGRWGSCRSMPPRRWRPTGPAGRRCRGSTPGACRPDERIRAIGHHAQAQEQGSPARAVDEAHAAEQVRQGQCRDEDAGVQGQVAAVPESDHDEEGADRQEEPRGPDPGLVEELAGGQEECRGRSGRSRRSKRPTGAGQLPSKLQLSTRTALGGSCLLMAGD